ncbi:hypothetical protein [Pannonibacter indicus]|uniref:hypothetical protein n=1 Tax=Pannonibacter indicus TaxID=466044 RepID=UPI00391C4DC6
MMRLLFAGLWVCLTTLGASYAAVYWMTQDGKGAARDERLMVGIDYEQLRAINVPIIENGALQGYVVVQLVFTADGDALRKSPVKPQPFIIDEAFRLLYTDEKLNFRRLERYDIEGLKSRVRDAVNTRLGNKLVQEILVEEFNYFTKSDVLSH